MRAAAILLLAAAGAAGALGADGDGDGGWAALWAGGGEYELESEVALGELAPGAPGRGWRVAAALRVAAAAQPGPDHHLLMHFELRAPQLWLKGGRRGVDWAARGSLWDDARQQRSVFAARLQAGRLVEAYLDPADPAPVRDFKRGIISLFQFQMAEGERNETDISGECSVLYEHADEHAVRKIKRGCRRAGAAGAREGRGEAVRRLARYSRRPGGALLAVHAEEVHELRAQGAPGAGGAGVKARAVTRLRLAAADFPPAPAQLPPHLQPADIQQPLRLHDTEEEDEEEEEWREASLESETALQLCAELGGTAPGAAPAPLALLRLLPAAAAANRSAAADLLARAAARAPDTLFGAARLLGAAGSGAALSAAAASLQLRDCAGAHAEQLARAFLDALALAARPQEAAVAGLLQLAGAAASGAVRAAALLAAAAAAPRVSAERAAALRDELAKQLARCKDEECRSLRLLALGNLRREDAAELLLEHAERGAAPSAAAAAVRALAALPAAALTAPRARRLLRLAARTDRPLELRGAALDLAVRALVGTPFELAHAARALHAEPAAHELRRAFWQRLRELAADHAPVRDFLRAARADPHLGTWDARAHAGTSSVFTREAAAGERGAVWLDAHSLAAGGLLRRARVAAGARAPGEGAALELELWTRGLGALAGGAEEDGEDAAAGLQLAVAGAALPPGSLFSGQAELLGHVWAGTGSSPTPVLRAQLLLGDTRARLPLLAGGELALRARAAAGAALDAAASASLWARTATARLSLRAAHAALATARAEPGWGAVRATAASLESARLRIAADLDFYSEVALCVRAHVDPREDVRAARLQSTLGARRWRVRVGREARTPRPGRTLALGADNARACSALAPRDDDE